MIDFIRISYSEILALRQSANCQMAYIDRVGKNQWRLLVNNGQFLYDCDIDKSTDEGSDGKDFVDNRQAYCNKPVQPNALEVKTHDYSDNSTWIEGTSNSLYCFQPMSGKKLQLVRTMMTTDKDLVIGGTQEIHYAIWESITESCPAYVAGTKTAYNDGPEWVKVYPTDNDDPQEVSVYIEFTGQGVPLWKVTEFVYPSIPVIMSKGTPKIYGQFLTVEFDYTRYGLDNVILKSSVNERIEVWIDDDTELKLSGGGNPAYPSTASLLFKSWDDW